jgi:hypothetical protein
VEENEHLLVAMRRAAQFLLLSITSAITSAQVSYLPDSNARWIAHYESYDSQYFWSSYFYLDQERHDTLINDTSYAVLKGFYLIGLTLLPDTFRGGLFDNGLGQVYYYHPGTARSYLLYDFDVQVGDSLMVWVGGGGYDNADGQTLMFIESVDSVYLAGKYRKVIGIENQDALWGNQGITQWWIQGIGGTGDLLGSTGAQSLDITGGLECMSASDTIWWAFGPFGAPGTCGLVGVEEHPRQASARASPNPSSGLFEITGHLSGPIIVQDVQGRVVLRTQGSVIDLSNFPCGVYSAVPSSTRYSQAIRLVVAR